MRIPLTSGAYQARSLIAGAQRCVNLYPEVNPQDSQAPVPVTHYQRPGLAQVAQSPTIARVRALYTASNGSLYACVGAAIYAIDSDFAFTLLGSIAFGVNPVSFSDNGQAIVIVDGTSSGYAIKMSDNTFGAISSAYFYGADRCDYIDTYFIFNKPGTTVWYISLSNASFAMLTGGSAFDSLDFAAKTGWSDPLLAVIAVHNEVWLIGSKSTEVWVNDAQADFTFSRLPGAFIEHGAAAKYSVAKHDVVVFFLTRDRDGHGIVGMSNGYRLQRISTHAIEAEIQRYSRIDDAIGWCYQQDGHTFYVLTFPTADVTWVYEMATGQWHQQAYTDQNGVLRRHRANCCTFAYDAILCGDWQNGLIYAQRQSAYTDNGQPISFIRSFPHLIQDGKRVRYDQFIVDMQVGTSPDTTPADPPLVSLRWSDDRGVSYGNAVMAGLGASGEYLTQINYWRLGIARDRVFEVSWSAPVRTALLGAFVEAKPLKS